MRRPTLLLLVMTAVTLPLALLFATAHRRPVVFHSRHFVVPNPFRDRAPERVAERFLEQLRAGNRAILAPVVPPENREHILQREGQYPLVRWRLTNRVNEAAGAWLVYAVYRGNGYCDCATDIAVRVEGTDDRGRVVEFSAVY